MSESSSTRRRVLVPEVSKVTVVEEPFPHIGKGEALVSLIVAGVCGSDLHAVAGKHPAVVPPYYPGHEVVGRVQAVGDEVSHVRAGQIVIPEPTLPCGSCKMCVTGRSNICQNLQFFGCGFREGGMSDCFAVSAERLHVIPGGLSDEQAVLIEPLATPVHAVRMADGVAGKSVVIIGCGTIGLLLLAAVRAEGAKTVVMTDMLESKRDTALRFGADFALDATSSEIAFEAKAALGETADVVFDCVAFESTIRSGIEMVERGGTVVVVGVPAGPLVVPAFEVQDHQIRLQGTATYTREDFLRAIEILEGGWIDAEQIVTASFPLVDASAAFEAARSGNEIKVVLRL